MEGWQKVKVGDKVAVRVLDVCEASGSVKIGMDNWLWPMQYEPVAVADNNGNKPKFKVGDRVRRIFFNNGTNMEVGETGTVVDVINEYTVRVDVDGGERSLYTCTHYLTPAPLTIRAGGYYRTRDGRKVGPASESSGGSLYPECKWEVDGVLYQDNGTFANGGAYASCNDLIAEWTDEPPAAGDSSNDTTDDWYFGKTAGYTVPLCAMEDDAPKFKVGDRVEYADDLTNGVGEIIEVLNESEFDCMVRVESKDVLYAYYSNGVGRKFTSANLRLVAEATSGKDDEPDAKLLVTISADTSALDAEIDRVLKKLKKLKKRARKLGIDLEYGELRDAA